ncbi:MAG TPA: ABC transporter permease [Acidimicrobiales bacterium]|nr:ABC transporter permease [Acidimicrobiales bacterium]
MTALATLAKRRPPGSFRRMWAVARRHAVVLCRTPHRLFDVTLWPLVDVMLFGTLAVYASRISGTGEVVVSYVLGGAVLWHIVYQSSIGLSTGFLEETWTRNLLNLMVTPISEFEYVAGVALFGLAKIVMGVAIASLGALAAYSFELGAVGWTLLPSAAVLLVIGWAIGLFVIGLVLRFGTGAEAMAWGVLFVVMPLSGTFTPVENLPGGLQPIARALPTTHVFSAVRSGVDGRGVDWNELGVAAALTAVAVVAGLWWITAMLKVFRRRGYVTRYS